MAWKPEKKEAIKALIRDTINAAGPTSPDALPHKIRDKVKAQIEGEIDLDVLIAEVLRDMRRD
jgi:hypothetical protein